MFGNRYRGCLTGVVVIVLCCVVDCRAEVITGEQMLAHRFGELAKRGFATKEIDTARIDRAIVLLDMATELDSGNAELWHLMVEAAEMGGSDEWLGKGLRGYIRCCPDDDVALMKLIGLKTKEIQTVEGRIAYLNRFVNSQQMSRALRSRMAFESGLLSREQGKMKGFIRMLSKALALDSTNKGAAFEAYALLVERGAALLNQAGGLFTLFNADPADARTRVMIGDMLLGVGLYDRAAKWYGSAGEIQGRNGDEVDLAMMKNWSMAVWGAGDVRLALNGLSQIDHMSAMAAAAEERAKLEEESDGTSSDLEQESVGQLDEGEVVVTGEHTPLDALILRLAIYVDLGEEELKNTTLELISGRFDELMKGSPDDIGLLSNAAWVKLMLGDDIEGAGVLIARLEEMIGDDNEAMLPLRGWLALQQGRLGDAKEIFVPLSESNQRCAFGLSEVYAREDGDSEKVNEMLARAFSMSPGDVIGVLSGLRLRRSGETLDIGDEGRAFGALFARVPDELIDIVAAPQHFLQFRIRSDDYRFDYCEPMHAQVELRNVGKVPLSLGAGGTVSTRLLILPTVSAVGVTRRQSPVVIDMARRLRLEPGHQIVLPLRLDSGALGALLNGTPSRQIMIRAKAMLNPRMSRDGRFGEGVMGRTAEIRGIHRRKCELESEKLGEYMMVVDGLDDVESVKSVMLLAGYVARAGGERVGGGGEGVRE